MSQRTFIVVKDQFDGFHCWKSAPNFLSNMHHHRFFLTVKIQTLSDGNMNRQFEFFAVREVIRKCIKDILPVTSEEGPLGSNDLFTNIKGYDLSGRSVEQFSNELNQKLIELLELENDHPMIIQVMEDDYAGSESYYNC